MTKRKSSTSIYVLELPVRAANCLDAAEIETVEDLVTWTRSELLALENMGPRSVSAIEYELALHGHILADARAVPTLRAQLARANRKADELAAKVWHMEYKLEELRNETKALNEHRRTDADRHAEELGRALRGDDRTAAKKEQVT